MVLHIDLVIQLDLRRFRKGPALCTRLVQGVEGQTLLCDIRLRRLARRCNRRLVIQPESILLRLGSS